MAKSAACILTIGRTADGYLIGVEGRGTLQQSLGFQKLVEDCLRDEGKSVAVDLSACGYLDSTFLGCLVTLNRKYGGLGRFQIAAPAEVRHNLFHFSRLENVLRFLTSPAKTVDGTVEVDVVSPDPRELALHIADAHRRLAELGGSEAESFKQIAQRIDDELARE